MGRARHTAAAEGQRSDLSGRRTGPGRGSGKRTAVRADGENSQATEQRRMAALPCAFDPNFKGGHGNGTQNSALRPPHGGGGKLVPLPDGCCRCSTPASSPSIGPCAPAAACSTSATWESCSSGAPRLANLNRLMTNDFSGMADGQARYSPCATRTEAWWTI